MKLFEREVKRPLRLTRTQKFVLLTVFNDPEPSSAFRQISVGGRKVLTAVDILQQLGVLSLDDQAETASLTDAGHKILRDEGLIDDTDTLTDKGNEILVGSNTEETESAPTLEGVNFLHGLLLLVDSD